MGDLISFVLYLAGFIVSIIVVVALCQLFAIRRGIEALVKLQSGGTLADFTQSAIVPAVVPAQPILEPPASLSPGDRKILVWVSAVVIVMAILIVVALTRTRPW